MSETVYLKASEEDAGSRLDVFVTASAEEMTRSRIQRLLEDGNLLVNGKVMKAGYKLRAGDEICLTVPEAKELNAKPEKMDLEILYEDEDLAIVNKPRGLVVHPAHGHEDGTMVNGLMYAFEGRLSGINGVLRPGIVHRIDKDTSGLLAVCKTDRAHLAMSEKMKEHDIERIYHTIVRGTFREKEGTIDKPIGRADQDRKKMCVRPDGRRAVTHYRVLETLGSYSYLEVRLETGRTHQIRVHMQSIGHPVMGDPLYGLVKETTAAGKKIAGMDFWPGQILHAKVLGFEHPVTGVYMRFDSELPAYFQTVLSVLRKDG